jgi:predicted transcriptional regulator
MKEKNLSIDKIMKKDPELSEREARFYISHNHENESYTIQDFMKYTNSSYETSRYSLEHLTKMGYYTKEKVGKKFVYKVN